MLVGYAVVSAIIGIGLLASGMKEGNELKFMCAIGLFHVTWGVIVIVASIER